MEWIIILCVILVALGFIMYDVLKQIERHLFFIATHLRMAIYETISKEEKDKKEVE